MYLLVVSAAILVCCMCIMAATIRLCFGMARDNRLPGSRTLAKVHPRLHTPIASCLAVAVIAAIPMFKYAGAGIVAIAATALIYLSYFLGNLAIMWARVKNGWPKVESPFKLGRWGMPVNVLALVYGGAMLVNFGWYGANRVASNPEPDQEPAGTLSLGLHFLNRHPHPLQRARLHPHHRAALLLPGRDPKAACRCTRRRSRVPSRSRRSRCHPTKSSPSDARRPWSVGRGAQCGATSKLHTTMWVRSPRNRSRANSTGGARCVEGHALDEQERCAARDLEELRRRGASARDRSQALHRPARPGLEARGQQLVERPVERLFEHPGEALAGKARLFDHEGPAVGETQAGHFEHRCAGVELQGGGHLGPSVFLLGVQEHGAGHQAVAPRLIGEPGEVAEVAFDGRFGHEGPALASRHASDEAASLEVGQGLAQRQPVDAEPGGQLAFGGRRSPWSRSPRSTAPSMALAIWACSGRPPPP